MMWYWLKEASRIDDERSKCNSKLQYCINKELPSIWAEHIFWPANDDAIVKQNIIQISEQELFMHIKTVRELILILSALINF